MSIVVFGGDCLGEKIMVFGRRKIKRWFLS